MWSFRASATVTFPITFASYVKVVFPLMLVSVAISTVFLLLRFT